VGETNRTVQFFIQLPPLRIAHDRFGTSAVQSEQSNLGSSYFHFRRDAFSSMLKSKYGLILDQTATLRINLNLDRAPITSQSHTHPSHSQTYRLLTSSLSLGVPVHGQPSVCEARNFPSFSL
jgi:hypothetical protein